MKNQIILTISVLALLAQSCSPGSSGSTTIGVNPTVPTTPTLPDGSGVITENPFSKLTLGQQYSQESCSNNQINNSSTKSYLFRDSTTDIRVEIDYFSSINCTGNLIYTGVIKFRMGLYPPDVFDPTFINVAGSLLDKTLKFYDQNIVDGANQSQMYTYSDWVQNQAKSIACLKFNPSATREPCQGDGSLFRSKTLGNNRIMVNGLIYE